MKKKLQILGKARYEGLYHYYNGDTIAGPNPYLKGDCTDLIGDCSRIVGDATNIYGDCSFLHGDITHLTGDVTSIHGRATGICGNLDACGITDKNREEFIMITDLIEHT